MDNGGEVKWRDKGAQHWIYKNIFYIWSGKVILMFGFEFVYK